MRDVRAEGFDPVPAFVSFDLLFLPWPWHSLYVCTWWSKIFILVFLGTWHTEQTLCMVFLVTLLASRPSFSAQILRARDHLEAHMCTLLYGMILLLSMAFSLISDSYRRFHHR